MLGLKGFPSCRSLLFGSWNAPNKIGDNMARTIITHELAHIWISSDGKKFFSKEGAQKHQDNINRLQENKNKRVFNVGQ